MPGKHEHSLRPSEKHTLNQPESAGLLTRFREAAKRHGYAIALMAGLYAHEAGKPHVHFVESDHVPELQADARTVTADYSNEHPDQEPMTERIPGTRVESEGDLPFLWAEHDFHRVDAERAEQEALRLQVRQVLDRYLAELHAQNLPPEEVLARIGITIEAFSSPEGWRHTDRNQSLSERRAQFAETLIREELRERHLDTLPVFIRSEGKGAEGDLLEFANRLEHDFGLSAHGSAEARRDAAERILAAMHDGNARALYRLLPHARHRLADLNRAYQDTVASHRRAHVKFIFETKDVSLVHTPSQPVRLPERRLAEESTSAVEYLAVPIVDPAVIREEFSEEDSEGTRVDTFPVKEPPAEHETFSTAEAPELLWGEDGDEQEPRVAARKERRDPKETTLERQRLETHLKVLSIRLTRMYSLGGHEADKDLALQEIARTQDALAELNDAEEPETPETPPTATDESPAPSAAFTSFVHDWNAHPGIPDELKEHLHVGKRPFAKRIGPKGSGSAATLSA